MLGFWRAHWPQSFCLLYLMSKASWFMVLVIVGHSLFYQVEFLSVWYYHKHRCLTHSSCWIHVSTYMLTRLVTCRLRYRHIDIDIWIDIRHMNRHDIWHRIRCRHMAETATLVFWCLLELKGPWSPVPSVEPEKPIFVSSNLYLLPVLCRLFALCQLKLFSSAIWCFRMG